MAFRQAHHVVGAVVALAEKLKKPLNKLSLKELQSVDKNFGADALDVFNLQKAMSQRNIIGAPGTKEVAKQLARWEKISQLKWRAFSRTAYVFAQRRFALVLSHDASFAGRDSSANFSGLFARANDRHDC